MTTSRLTFREQTEISWQKILRDQFNDEGVPPVPHLSLKKAVVKAVSYRFAKQIILKYEWLGTMGPSTYHYGIFFGPYCAGVCCFAIGGGTGGAYVHKPFLIEYDELAILIRGACVHWAPPGSNSKLVSLSTKMLLKSTKALLVLAYSDSDAGEIGTIYQACNWVYIGKGGSTTQYVSRKNRVMDQKIVHDVSKQNNVSRKEVEDALLKSGWRKQKSNPKGRYAFTLNVDLKNRLEQMRKPYPKRPTSIDSDALAIPG